MPFGTKIKTFVHGSWFGLFTFVVGIVLTAATYYGAQQYRHLVININPAKALIVKAGQSSKLSVSYGGAVVEGDITVAQIAIWNEGNLSIRKENVLEPIELTCVDAVILEATVRSVSRPLVHLRIDAAELKNGKLLVSWDILERGDGAVIQIIYTGKPINQVRIHGAIEGQGVIEFDSLTTRSSLIGSGAFTLFVITVILICIAAVRREHLAGWNDWISFLLILGCFLALAVVAGLAFWKALWHPIPPFVLGV